MPSTHDLISTHSTLRRRRSHVYLIQYNSGVQSAGGTGPGHTASETHIQGSSVSEPTEPSTELLPKVSRIHWLYELIFSQRMGTWRTTPYSRQGHLWHSKLGKWLNKMLTSVNTWLSVGWTFSQKRIMFFSLWYFKEVLIFLCLCLISQSVTSLWKVKPMVGKRSSPPIFPVMIPI